MTRRRLLTLVCFSAPLVGVAVACSFPNVDYATTPDGHSQIDGNVSEASGDAADDGGGQYRDDATAIVTPDACKGIACDCDDDGYLAKECDASTQDASGKLPGDCDDLDPLQHPGQSIVYEKPTGANIGDWNCDGTVDYQYLRGQECVAGSLGILLSGCVPKDPTVFAGTPACGESQPTSTCGNTNGACAFTAGAATVEGCK